MSVAQSKNAQVATVDVNGVALHYERRGDGPPVVFVSGAGGDAAYWTHIADALADEYTVVTYDRRGNSRSGAPADYTSTTVEEHADDAAGLIDALSLGHAVVCGLSSGAVIATDLLLRHPDRVRSAFMHEPLFIGALADPEQAAAGFQAMMEQGMQQGGLRVAMEMTLRFTCGNDVYDMMDPALEDRVLSNGDVFFTVEMPAMVPYLPDDAALSGVTVPSVVTAGTVNAAPAAPLHMCYQTSQWLAERLGNARFQELPGAHVPSLSHPDAYIAFLRDELANIGWTRAGS